MTLANFAVSRRVASLLAVLVGTAMLVPANIPGATAGTESGDSVVMATAAGHFSVLNAPSGDSATLFGNPGDQPLMGDWNCDGIETPGVYRSQIAEAFVTNSTSSGATNVSFYLGNPGDTALAGDFDGDGCDTIAVYRSSSSVFYFRNTLTSGVADTTLFFGNPGDQPFVGDFDGDGKDTVGVYRSTGWVYYTSQHNPFSATIGFPFGNPGDQILAEDFDGDGRDVVAAYRPSQGRIYVARTAESLVVGKNQVAIAATVKASAWSIPSGPAQQPAPAKPTAPSPRPTPPPTSYDIDIDLWPGDDLRSIVDDAPEGTVFRINGLHIDQSIEPRDRQVFIGAPGAELRGDDAERAFSSSARGVVIENLQITNYRNRPQDGVIQASGDDWVIRNNDIHHNATVGVKVTRGDNATITGNNIHHNGQLGMAVAFSSDTLVENNEIAFNNWQVEYSWGWEAGGTKFWTTDGLVVRNNWSHDNHGPGLWSDYNNIHILYEGNLVEDNYGCGIFHEIGYDGIVRNNVIRRNGLGAQEWLWGAGIVIAASQNVEIYGNELTGNFNGITLVQQDRGSGDYGPFIVRNNHVYDNRIVDSGMSGAARDTDSQAIFDADNTFTGNDYVGTSTWAWDNSERSWNSWRSYGHDATGSYSE